MATATKLIREKDIEAYLVRRVNELGGVTWKWSSPGHAGVPDRIVIVKGRVGFIELKAPGKRPTDLQMRELLRIARQDVCAWWGDSKKDVDDFLVDLQA